MPRVYEVICAHQECGARYNGASKWTVMRAYEAGWFNQTNGKSWCPEHVPEWVSAWREAKAKEERYEACLEAE